MKKHGFVEWSEENIIKAVYPVSANKEFLHFSSGSPIEYSKCEPPQNWNDYINDIRFVINDRQKKTGNRVLLCDSGLMTCGFDKETGVKDGETVDSSAKRNVTLIPKGHTFGKITPITDCNYTRCGICNI